MPPLTTLLRLRVAFLLAVVAALFGGRMATMVTVPPVPPLPIALLQSFDEAVALVSDAAEQRIAALEQQRPAPRNAPTLAEAVARLDLVVTAACSDARAALDRAIASLATTALPADRRATVLASIDRQLEAAHRATAATSDPAVRLEYDATYQQLRAIRAVI